MRPDGLVNSSMIHPDNEHLGLHQHANRAQQVYRAQAQEFNAHLLTFGNESDRMCDRCTEIRSPGLFCQECISYLCAACATNDHCHSTGGRGQWEMLVGPRRKVEPHEIIWALRGRPEGLDIKQLCERLVCPLKSIKRILRRMRQLKLLGEIRGYGTWRHVLEHDCAPPIRDFSISRSRTGTPASDATPALIDDSTGRQAQTPDMVSTDQSDSLALLESLHVLSCSSDHSKVYQSDLTAPSSEKSSVLQFIAGDVPGKHFSPEDTSIVGQTWEPGPMAQRPPSDLSYTAPNLGQDLRYCPKMAQQAPLMLHNSQEGDSSHGPTLARMPQPTLSTEQNPGPHPMHTSSQPDSESHGTSPNNISRGLSLAQMSPRTILALYFSGQLSNTAFDSKSC